MRQQVKALLFGHNHNITEGERPMEDEKPPVAAFAVQLRVRLNHAMTMAQAEEDTAAILRSLPVTLGLEVVETETYEY